MHIRCIKILVRPSRATVFCTIAIFFFAVIVFLGGPATGLFVYMYMHVSPILVKTIGRFCEEFTADVYLNSKKLIKL